MLFSIYPAGDRALVCQFDNRIDEKVNAAVCSLGRKICLAAIPGVEEVQPTYRSLTVFYDPAVTSFRLLSEKIKKLSEAEDDSAEQASRILRIPCCYRGHFGTELERVAKNAGLTKEEVIYIHSSVDYKVYMLGFLPGFVYLGGLDERIHTPRLSTPRLKIPAGAVGIGGSQTGVYPIVSPGGWNIIGGTPLNFYDPAAQEPILCRAGDILRFVPISSCDYYDIRQDMMKGVCSWL